MKKFSILFTKAILVLFLCVALMPSCKKEKNYPNAMDRDTSYAFGMVLANFMQSEIGLVGLSFDYQAFMEGFRDFNEAEETRLSWEKAGEKISAAFERLQSQMEEEMRLVNEEMWLLGEKNREEGEAYLAENGKRSGVITTDSGLQYEVLAQGSGKKPQWDDMVQVHYEGRFIDGEVFESSYAKNEPVEFFVGQVIPGWQEGLQLMNEGSTYNFVIPSDIAYGPGGNRDIPPNATLVFKIELISILQF